MINVHYFTFNGFQENTYILSDDTKECVIIDPGCYSNEEQQILANYISDNDLKPVKLLNTHCHIDHVLGNNFVANKYNVGLEMHEKDLPTLHATPEYGQTFGFNIDKSPEPTTFLEEGDVVKFGDSELHVLFTPGHCTGHIVFVSHDDKFVINGDVLFRGSIGRTDLPGGDYETLITSIKTKMMTLPEDYEVFSGHGPSTTVGFEKSNNPFLNQ
ncbi:MAG: MBL fold metallo-hydrolase [Flavobacteriales bacterium]|nr:MBL fold metallo-hydrolase [Flavobacteriales bacterium]NQX99253.1 MBL fold metallo-hydrolase [Flavobacteriales bacterium]